MFGGIIKIGYWRKSIDLDQRRNINALTNLIQLARYAFKKDSRLVSLYGLFLQRFNLYVGSTNHNLSETQVDLMRKIAEYIVNDGAISTEELNSVDADLWRYGIREFGVNMFAKWNANVIKICNRSSIIYVKRNKCENQHYLRK